MTQLPTTEDIEQMKQVEAEALQNAQAIMNEFQTMVSGMSPEARAEMDPSNPEVIRYVEERDRASAARVLYEQLRSERASAEPMLRYQEFMDLQKSDTLPVGLIESRYHMAKMNYMNSLLGEYEALSVMMVQGPEVLEQYDQAQAARIKWAGEYESAKRSFELQPTGILNPMSMQPFEPMAVTPTLDDYSEGDTNGEEE